MVAVIAALLAVVAIGLAGSVGFPPPASRWLLAFAFVAGGLLAYIAIASVLSLGWFWRRRDHGYRFGAAYRCARCGDVEFSERHPRGMWVVQPKGWLR